MLCVTATDEYDDLPSFANWGGGTVHLAAPGKNIYSTTWFEMYQTYSGTSMATAYVAGAAALVWDFVPRLTNLQLREILISSGDSISKLAGRIYSGKRLNLYNALIGASSYAWAVLENTTLSVPASGSSSIMLRLGGSGLPAGEYRGSLKVSSGTLERYIPVILSLHNFSYPPTVGAQSLQFEDQDRSPGLVSGALTILRAVPDDEKEISQYRVY